MAKKKWYQSKTLWINAFAIVGGVLSAISGEMAAGGVITVIGVANVIVRAVTKNAVTWK